jgi:subtilase family serine protease
MSPSRFFLAPRPAAIARRPRIRRQRRSAPACETLESRQLLATGTAATTIVPAALQVLPMVNGGYTTYTPQQIDSAYGIGAISFSGSSGGSTITGTGAGQTIAIVDAYSDPNIQSDLAKFDANYGLSAPPSFTVDDLAGSATNSGWALETSLDVEWAHAIAPQANIVLVEASSASLSSLMGAVSTAASIPNVSVVSMSWGSSEFSGESGYAGVFSTPAGHNNETFIAASGDSGAWSGPTFPSVLPDVLAVGGTTLTLSANGTYSSESGWTDSTGGFSGLDNGFRSGISIPSYQVSTLQAAGLDYGLRTTPDVSFNADPNTGYAVYDSVPYSGSSGWFDVGGTSAAAPAWAGLVAITDQGLAASSKSTLTTTQLLTDLYSLPSTDFHDVTSGFNGYDAGVGYDLVTGLGTPRANLIVSGLLGASGVKTSTITTSGATTSTGATTVHNAAVAASTATGSTTAVVTTSSVASSVPSGLAALSTSASATTSPSGTTAAIAPAAASTGSTSTTSTTAIGVGQATSSSTVGQLFAQRADAEPSDAPTDAIETEKDREPLPASSKIPQQPTPETQAPERSPSVEGAPEALPKPSPPDLPSPVVPDSAGDRSRPSSDATAIRLDRSRPTEEEADTGSAVASAPGSGPGLMIAGAVVALGHRMVFGPRRRRRPVSSAFRPMVR